MILHAILKYYNLS